MNVRLPAGHTEPGIRTRPGPVRIANIMLNRTLGVLQQVSVDYALGLQKTGAEVLTITHPQAAINAEVEKAALLHATLPSGGKWDMMAGWRLRSMLRRWQPDIVICHGGRAVMFAARAVAGEMLLIGVGHSYRFRALEKMDYAFAITRHMAAEMAARHVLPADRLFFVPNSIETEGEFSRAERPGPPHIGAMGRFVEDKGFDVHIEALALLKRRGRRFRATLGGAGRDEAKLKALAERHGLGGDLDFPGWIKDRSAFLKEIDLFCLPSNLEPFGIVLLEAMAASLPIVSTDSEGPVEILEHGVTGLLVPRGNASAMADAMAACLDDKAAAQARAANARAHVLEHYERSTMMAQLARTLEEIRADYRRRAVPPLPGVGEVGFP